MKRIAFKFALTFCFFTTTIFSQSVVVAPVLQSTGPIQEYDTMIVNGFYNGENPLIVNPFASNGMGFSVTEVKVNGSITTDEINATVFQVNLSHPYYKLKLGDKVRIKIYFKKDRQPYMMNPGVLLSSYPSNEDLSLICEGVFVWQNLFVSNTRSPGGTGFGIKEVIINGKPLTSQINSDIFEIKLNGMDENGHYKEWFKEGDKLKIEFKYKKGCDPIILNPEAIKSTCTSHK